MTILPVLEYTGLPHYFFQIERTIHYVTNLRLDPEHSHENISKIACSF